MYEPRNPCPGPSKPVSSPSFHQISLPLPPDPPRKLQAVRFWTHTSLARHTMIPFRPYGVPWESLGPKFWSLVAVLQDGPDLVPSTITLLRFMPRMNRCGVVTSTPDGSSGLPLGALTWWVL